jgi:hypothetical protein
MNQVCIIKLALVRRTFRTGSPAPSPRSVLMDDPKPIGIFERHTGAIPIGIERLDRSEAGALHAIDGRLPGFGLRQIEDQQVVLRRRPSG